VRCDPALIKAEKNGLWLDAANGEAGDVGQSVVGIGIAEQFHVVDGSREFDDRPDEPKGLLGTAFESERIERYGHGSETEDRDERFESGSSSAFLVTALEERFESEAPSDDQHSCAARSTESMPTEREQIRAEAVEVDGNLTNGV
jgi:hypothetical protein